MPTSNKKKRKREKELSKMSDLRQQMKMPPLFSKEVHQTALSLMKSLDATAKSKKSVAKTSLKTYIRDQTHLSKDLNFGITVQTVADKPSVCVVIDSTRKMDDAEVKKCIKANFKESEISLCDASSLGITGSFQVRLDSVDGPLIAIVFRDLFTSEEVSGSLHMQDLHESCERVWNKGCEADVHPTSSTIWPQFKSQVCMKSAGFTSNNVKEIVGIESSSKTGTGSSVVVKYQNSKGAIVNWRLSSALNRLTHDLTRCDSTESKLLVKKMSKIYSEVCPLWAKSRGATSTDLKHLDSALQQSSNLKISTMVLSNQHSIGVHRDPRSNLPAAICGHYSTTVEHEKVKGGRLFLMEYLFDLSYKSGDLVFMDGNIAHGVTTVANSEVKRFSMIMFSTFNRQKGMCAPGNFKGYYSK
eukprot:scaffold9650_cov50-Cyclotella_meneghiniana.AAC.5